MDGRTQSQTAMSDDVTAILDLFFSSFASDTPSASQDVEFALRDGRVYIPRLEPLEDVNKLIEAGPDQETIVYEVPHDNSKGLKLNEKRIPNLMCRLKQTMHSHSTHLRFVGQIKSSVKDGKDPGNNLCADLTLSRYRLS